MRIFRRAQPIFVIVVSILVLSICAIVIAGTWFLEGKITSAIVAALEGVDITAQTMRNGIGRVDTGLIKFGDAVNSVEKASEELAQNINDRGLVLNLLSSDREQELTLAIESVQQDFLAIQDLLETTSEMLQMLDSIPFIDTPGKGLAAVETLQDGLNQVIDQVDVLNSEIGEFRSEAAAGISRITAATSRINRQVEVARSDMALVDSDLNALQVQSKKLQRLTPTVLLLNSIFVTLLGIWVIYSQVVMIDRSLKRYRDIRSQETVIEPGETGGSSGDDEFVSIGKITDAIDADQKEID